MTVKECLRAAFVLAHPDKPESWIDDAVKFVESKSTKEAVEELQDDVGGQQQLCINHFRKLIETPGELLKEIENQR